MKEKVLGQGSYGIVYQTDDGKALKRNLIDADMSFMGSLKELEVLSKLREYPYIVSLVDTKWGMVSETKVKDKSLRDDIVHFVFEKADCDLHSFIYSEEAECDENTYCIFIIQLLLALDFIHRNNIIHRDIKPSNILIFKNDDEYTMKLCDFGMCGIMNESTTCKTPSVYTFCFRPPEIFDKNEYNEKADIWALGATIYEMVMAKHLVSSKKEDKTSVFTSLARKIPFDRQFWDKYAKYEGKPLFKGRLSKEFYDNLTELLSHMISYDKKERWSCEQLLHHKMFEFMHTKIDRIREEYKPQPIQKQLRPKKCFERDEAYRYAKKALEYSKTGFWNDRMVFLALDLYERTLVCMDIGNSPEAKMEADACEMVFLVCMYIAIKYLNTMYVPVNFLIFVDALLGENIAKCYSDERTLNKVAKLEMDILKSGLNFNIYSETEYEKLSNPTRQKTKALLEKLNSL